MCADSWGRSSFARALIEVSADNVLKDQIVVAIPKLEEDGFIMEKVKLEYEWKPHHCANCCIFGHNDQNCPKNVNVSQKQVTVDEEGFVTDKRKVARFGVGQKKQKQKFVYKPKPNKSGASTSGTKQDNSSGSSHIKTVNPFEVLASVEGYGEELGDVDIETRLHVETNRSTKTDDEVKEVTPTEMAQFMTNNQYTNSEGASTPGLNGLNG
ncbi:uncharacterized protein LOC110900513 [Helianthus annuus]|uniref:uncharacterized protein LOC110900513 n=1 Tax=Helianthus annuus TaxID=4232 RepID=UPI000B8EEE83|nr:uncharacterized protein LOC110900513 [Helianthus annuus]